MGQLAWVFLAYGGLTDYYQVAFTNKNWEFEPTLELTSR